MSFDVAVVGAGTAGSAAALACARRGLRVALLEARVLDKAGARWVNGVPGWCFDQGELERPSGPELHSSGVPFHLVAGWDGPKVVAEGMDLLDVDMRLLVRRLQGLAREAGVTLLEETSARDLDNGVLRTTGEDIKADWYVDASGLRGAGLLERPLPAARDLCVAAQEVRQCTDAQAAQAFFQERGVPPGEVACFTGIAGGYSVVNTRVSDDQVSLLTGSIPGQGHPSGRVLLDRFALDHHWVGDVIFGGSRALPLREPYLRLAEGPVALIGDAGCQVFATHGSGIGAGLVAARMLGESLAEGRGVWDYCVRWQRRWGGLFAGSALFARHSQGLTVQDLGRLIAGGLMGGQMVADGLEQSPPRLHLRALADMIRGALRERRQVRRLVPILVRMARLERIFRSFPEQEDQVGRWARTHQHLGVAEP